MNRARSCETSAEGSRGLYGSRFVLWGVVVDIPIDVYLDSFHWHTSNGLNRLCNLHRL